MLYPDKYVVRVSVCKNRSGYNSPASYYARHEEGVMEMKWVCLFLLPWAFVELSGQVAC